MTYINTLLSLLSMVLILDGSVAYFTMRTYGVNQDFRFAEGIWLHRKSRQIQFFLIGNELFDIIRAQYVVSYHLI